MSYYFKNIINSVFDNEKNKQQQQCVSTQGNEFGRIKETWGWFVDPEEVYQKKYKQKKQPQDFTIKKFPKVQSTSELYKKTNLYDMPSTK